MDNPMNVRRPSVPPRPAGNRKQRGTSLLEILVSLLVISVGMLGIAGLITTTFSYNKTAQIRLVGLALVNDYADQARVNVYGYDLGGYDISISDSKPTKPTIVLAQTDPEPLTTAQNLAAFDKFSFMTAVEQRLPGGKAIVNSIPTAGARDLDFWLLWTEAKAGADDELFKTGQVNCPNDLGAEDKKIYSCMYFKVGL